MLKLRDQIKTCKGCDLHKNMPDGFYPVCGFGPFNAEIVLCGEALGETECYEQRPFVGLAGALLTKMMTEAGLNRQDCYITNIVKCRPVHIDGRKNRPPTKDEILTCVHWIYEEIKRVQPKILVTLGKVPTEVFIGKIKNMHDIVGHQYHDLYNFVVVPAYHPSFISVYGRKYYNKEVDILKQIHKLVADGET